MEKDSTRKFRRIVINGPESTGKTELSAALALHFHTVWVPEYAREYVESLSRPYNYNDVIKIARKQTRIENQYLSKADKFIFFDTDLIITKVWLEEVYGSCPAWIDNYLQSTPVALYLLCQTDLPWVYDPVRENGGEMREILFNRYLAEIKSLGYPYFIVTEQGPQRLINAIGGIQSVLL